MTEYDTNETEESAEMPFTGCYLVDGAINEGYADFSEQARAAVEAHIAVCPRCHPKYGSKV